MRTVQTDWLAPLTNRLLVEAGASYVGALFLRRTFGELDSSMILRREQTSGLYWGGPYFDLRTLRNTPIHKRFVVSYVTGTHSAKVGATHTHGYGWERKENPKGLSYQLNVGVPNQITLYAEPWEYRTDIDHDMAVFAQDRWAIRDRLTFTYGLRYDYFANSFPEQYVGPTPFAPTRSFLFPKERNSAWHDVSPRLGAACTISSAAEKPSSRSASTGTFRASARRRASLRIPTRSEALSARQRGRGTIWMEI